MPLLSPPPTTTFLSSSSHSSAHSSCSQSYTPLLFSRSRNGANITRGRVSLLAFGRKGLLPLNPFSCFALNVSTVNDPQFLATSVGPPPSTLSLAQWNYGPRHIFLLNVIACTVAVSTSWLFFSVIPTLLAVKRAAESLEKLFDVTTEELPDTMAAMRLSGMEISELTMELSDLGREITQGVRRSTHAVRVAEERLRRFASMDSIVSTQEHKCPTEIERPQVAKRARDLREGIIKGRTLFGAVFSVSHFSRWAWNFFKSRHQRR